MNQMPMPHEPQPLRFEPDEKRLARLARFRKVVLGVTIGLMMMVLVWMILIPTRVSNISPAVWSIRNRFEPQVTEESLRETPAPLPPAQDTKSIKPNQLTEAKALVRGIDSSLNAVTEQWFRAAGLVNAVSVRLENVSEMLRRIEIARAIGDSARAQVAQAEIGMSRFKELLRVPGFSGMRINNVYSAAQELMVLVKEETADREGWLSSFEQAIRALAEGDSAQFDIKLNVAGAYQRKSEIRQRRLNRAKQILYSAVRDWR